MREINLCFGHKSTKSHILELEGFEWQKMFDCVSFRESYIQHVARRLSYFNGKKMKLKVTFAQAPLLCFRLETIEADILNNFATQNGNIDVSK